MTEKQITIHDIAARAGVSIATVSRALSGGCASKKSKALVEAAIQELKYEPVSMAERVRRAETKCITLVVSELTNPYYAALCSGAEEEARKNGYSLRLCSPMLEHQLDNATFDRLLEMPCDGAVLVGSAVENGTNDEILEHLLMLQQRMPIVTIGPRIAGLSCVNIHSDLSVSVRKSIAHLYALGHRRIAFIGGSDDIRSSCARRRSFFEEIKNCGLKGDSETSYETGFTPQAGEIGVNKLLSRLPRSEWPTALITINDLVALGAMHQLQRMGLSVPADMAIIGCDNQFFTPYLNPPLTTVDLHPADHGRCAVDELINILHGADSVSYTQIRECSLIVRESCGALLGVRDLS